MISKICHIVDTLNVGGLERTLIQIVSNVKGYEHQVWCLKDKGALADELEARGIKIREFFFSGRLRIGAILHLAACLRKEGFNIIHSHGLFPSVWGRISAVLAGAPVSIVHCQNVYYGITRKERLKLKFLSYFTSRIIAVSFAVRDCLVKFVGVAPEKIRVIHNSSPDLQEEIRGQNREEIRESFGFKDADLVLGCIGRLEEHKGQRYLIEAVAVCKKRGIICKCLLAGEGPRRQDLSRLILELGLGDEVVLSGLRKDVSRVLWAMDIFILPSTIREGLPLVLAEASSMGLPLIAGNVGGNSEIIKDEYNGLLVNDSSDIRELAAKIEYLAGNKERRVKMGRNSRERWVEEFSLEVMIRRIEFIYRELSVRIR